MRFLNRLTPIVVVIAGLAAIGVPVAVSNGTPHSYAGSGAESSPASGSTSRDAGLASGRSTTGFPAGGGVAVLQAEADPPALATLPRGGPPVPHGMLASLILLSGLGLMFGRTLFKVGRLSAKS